MTTDDPVRRALSDLAAADRARHAPSDLERVLLDAFDRSAHERRAGRNTAVAWTARLAAVAAVLLVTTVGLIHFLSRDRRATMAPSEQPVVTAAQDGAGARDRVLSPSALSPAPRIASKDDRPRGRVSRGRTTDHRRRTVRDADVAIPAPAAFEDIVRVVRMRLPRATLASLGIPVIDPGAAGTVDVELLIGVDGLARTIRTVR
jgi:hypothetical protein